MQSNRKSRKNNRRNSSKNIGQNNRKNMSQNRRQNIGSSKNIRKRKKVTRWDKIIAKITILIIIAFGFIIYKDLHSTSGETVEAANSTSVTTTTAATTKTQSESTVENAVVCIDAGHGGTDSGAEYQGTYEKDQVLTIALLVKQALEKQGVTVVMTRTSDETLELEDRVNVSNEASAVALVSIHRNYYLQDTTIKGVEAWIHSSDPSDSELLASSILTNLQTISGVTNRGVKTGTEESTSTNYYINSQSACASCIIELGFMTNSSDSAIVTTNKSKTAQAVADGIIKYLDEMGYHYG